MLISSLKLRGYEKLNPIFVGWCGVTSAILGFLKAFYEKRIVLNLDKQSDPIDKEIMNLSKIEKIAPLNSLVNTLLEISKN